MKHTCHALKCSTVVPPKLFMCKEHWYVLPLTMRERLWVLYRPGQEVDKDPSVEYLEHAMACVRYVADREGIQ